MLTTIYNIESNVKNSNIIQISHENFMLYTSIQTKLTNNFILLFLYNSYLFYI